MNAKLEKIKTYGSDMIKTYQNDVRFSIGLANVRFLTSVKGYLHMKSSPYAVHKRVHDYMMATEKEIIEKKYAYPNHSDQPKDSPIWVCWWQGLEQAPVLVKQCVKSLYAHSGTHPVHLLTKDNFGEYLDIPSYILDKVNDGRMCIANFSDYLRFSLLALYGGLWVDSTIYVARDIGDYVFSRPLFTCKAKAECEDALANHYISNGRWTGFLVGGVKGHPFFCFMKEAIEEYWKKNDTSIDYLYADHLMHIAYITYPEIKADIDAIPFTNMQRNDLSYAMLKGRSAEDFYKIVSKETDFYKLSWRGKYPEKTKDCKESLYSYFCRMEI